MRLKQELGQFGGTSLLGDGVSIGPGGQTIVEVEKIIHIDNTEKMQQMEDQLEKDKLLIKKQFEK